MSQCCTSFCWFHLVAITVQVVARYCLHTEPGHEGSVYPEAVLTTTTQTSKNWENYPNYINLFIHIHYHYCQHHYHDYQYEQFIIFCRVGNKLQMIICGYTKQKIQVIHIIIICQHHWFYVSTSIFLTKIGAWTSNYLLYKPWKY